MENKNNKKEFQHFINSEKHKFFK